MRTLHEMVLIRRGESGDDWACPQCGRRILVRWEPDFERLVLDRGDDHVAHTGGQGMALAAETSGRLAEHDRTWLREHGIESDDTPG